MELFGIGIWEIFLIVLIALIILGPQDTVRAGRNFGRAIRRFFSSEEWRTLLQASKDIRTIPDKLLEETGLDHPEDLIPSEAEIREQAGLNDLERDMSTWKSDLSAMKQGTDPQQPGQPLLQGKQEIRQESGLEDLERDLSQWKADLSAWGSSPVIIPTPQAAATIPAQTPAVSEPAPAAPEQADPAARAESAPADAEQSESASAAQEPSSSTEPATSSEQEQ